MAWVGDQIIVHICWRLGNLKRPTSATLGNPQRPMSVADVWMPSASSNIGIQTSAAEFKHGHVQVPPAQNISLLLFHLKTGGSCLKPADPTMYSNVGSQYLNGRCRRIFTIIRSPWVVLLDCWQTSYIPSFQKHKSLLPSFGIWLQLLERIRYKKPI